ncbi:MAG: ABC transporter substrate-binding protein [Janthinobacterium lividum]
MNEVEAANVASSRACVTLGAWVIRAAISAVSLVALDVQSVRAADNSLPVVIGVLNDQSGAFADLGGKGSVIAAQMAVDDFGGIVLGRPVKVISADHQNKPDIASSIASRWFDEEHVGMITDMTFSSAAIAMQNVARQRQKISIDVGAATTELINKSCSPTSFMWGFNTYTEAVAETKAVIKQGGDTWALIVADLAFGYSLSADIKNVLAENKATLLSEQRYPFGSSDFSSLLLVAQASGAKVLGLVTAGADMVNAVRQAAEFSLAQKLKIAVPAAEIFEVDAIGLERAQGLFTTESWYWDLNEETRDFSNRYAAKFGRVPGQVQAGVYSGVAHYLKSVAAAGTDEGLTVASKMRELPVNDVFTKNGKLRIDGWLMHDIYLVQIKAPEQSKSKWDVYNILATIPAEEAASPLSKSECPLVTR